MGSILSTVSWGSILLCHGEYIKYCVMWEYIIVSCGSILLYPDIII